MKIFLLHETLNEPGGGTERVISIMTNYWLEKGWKIALLTLNDDAITPYYKVNNKALLIPLARYHNIPLNGFINFLPYYNIIKLTLALRLEIKKHSPHAVISFSEISNIISIMATRYIKIRVIIAERDNAKKRTLTRKRKFFKKMVYPLADKMVLQSQGHLSNYSDKIKAKSFIIPNPALLPQYEENKDISVPTPSIVAMGNFKIQKGFDLLIKAFSNMSKKYSHWHLIILGDGDERKNLERLRDQLGVTDRVHLPGFTNNPHPVLREAEIFILSSRWEGFPNALVEAMTCGLPVIAMDCNYGPADIIRNNVDGILVENENTESLCRAMESLVADHLKRKQLGDRAKEITSRFNVNSIMSRWESIF